MISLRSLKGCPPFDDESLRDELLTKLQQLPGLIATGLARDGLPMVGLTQLADKNVFDKAVEILGWVVNQIESTADAKSPG